MQSYAQDQEDIILMLMLHNVREGHYVDIGANDPDYLSVTKLFYEDGWRGVNVEPLPNEYQKLVAQRPHDINIQAAVGDKPEDHKTLYVNGMLSSFNPIPGAETIDVSVITLKQIAENYCALYVDVHFCKIDVEGYERQVLEGNDWELFRPWVFCIESTIPETDIPCYMDWEPILLSNDYEFVYQHGINRYYRDTRRTVRRELRRIWG